MKEREGRVAVPGGEVWFRVVGEGPRTPLLLLHGGPGASSRAFEPLRRLQPAFDASESRQSARDRIGRDAGDIRSGGGCDRVARVMQATYLQTHVDVAGGRFDHQLPRFTSRADDIGSRRKAERDDAPLAGEFAP